MVESRWGSGDEAPEADDILIVKNDIPVYTDIVSCTLSSFTGRKSLLHNPCLKFTKRQHLTFGDASDIK